LRIHYLGKGDYFAQSFLGQRFYCAHTSIRFAHT